MYKIKNLAEKTLNKKLLEEFLDFANKKLEVDKPYSVYFVDDKSNATDPLGKTAMYNPTSNSVYVYATNRHPKDILRSVAHELMHHKQNCDGRLDKTYGEGSDDLETLELEANEAGYLVRQFEDSRTQTLNEVAGLVAAVGITILSGLLFKGDTPEEMMKNNLMKKLTRKYQKGTLKNKVGRVVTEAEFKKMLKDVKNSMADKTTLEDAVEYFDLIGMFPGIGDIVDLFNIIPKLELARRYYGKPDEVKIPFTDYGIKKSNFYLIDAAISALSAIEIGEPLKIIKLVINKGIKNADEALFFSEAALKLGVFMSDSKLDLFTSALDKLGIVNKRAVEIAARRLRVVAARARILANNLKSAKKFEKTLTVLNQANPLELFEIIYKKGEKYGLRKFDDAVIARRFNKIAETIVRRLAKSDFALKADEGVKAFDDFFANLGSVDPRFLEDIKDINFTTSQKAVIGYVLSLADTSKQNFKTINDQIISPIVRSIRQGEPIYLQNLEKLGIPGNLAANLEKLKFDFSKPVKAAQDYIVNAHMEMIDMESLMVAFKEIIGKELKRILSGVISVEFKNIKDTMEGILKGQKKMSDLPKSFSEITDFFNNQLSQLATQVQNQFSNVNQSSELLNKMANATERNMLLTATVPSAQRVISKAKAARAGVKASVKTSDLFIRAQQAATRVLSKAIDRNFLGKGFASGLYITPVGARAVNFAGYLVGRHLNLINTGSLTQRAVSAVLATSYFTWLRVLSAEDFLPGGGGKEGLEKEAKAAQSTADSVKPIAIAVAAASEFIEEAAESENPIPLPGEVTEALNKAEKIAPKKTKPIVIAARKAAKAAAKGPKEAAAAAKELKRTINAAAEKTKAKYDETVKESPKTTDLPPDSQTKAENNSKKIDGTLGKPDASKGAPKGDAKSGDTGAGKGGGKRGGKGSGNGAGLGQGASNNLAVRDFLDIYLRRRARFPDKGHNKLPLLLRQLDEKIGDKLYEIYKALPKNKTYGDLDDTKEKHPSVWLYDTELANNPNNNIFSTKNIKDLNVKKTLKFLNSAGVKTFIKKQNTTKESIEQYRNKVLNERYKKLVKGFTKESK